MKARGRTNFLAVLQTQRDLFESADALVESEQGVASELVTLYKALGGGCEVEAGVGEPPTPGRAGKRVIDVAGTR